MRLLLAGVLAWTSLCGSTVHAAGPKAPASYMTWGGVWKRAPGFSTSADPSRPQGDEEAGPRGPFRPAWDAAHSTKDRDRLLLENRGADCLPQGMPQVMGMVYLMETLVSPSQFTIVSEYGSAIRRIYVDGRPHPKVLWPTYHGHSIGHWEGQTLVAETVSVMPLPFMGGILSDKTRIVERFRLVDANTLEDVITVEDPLALEKPVTTVRRYVREPGEINEYVCQENNHNGTDESGKATYAR